MNVSLKGKFNPLRGNPQHHPPLSIHRNPHIHHPLYTSASIHNPNTPPYIVMPQRIKRSRQCRIANLTGKRARHARPHTPRHGLQLPIGFGNPNTGSEAESQGNFEVDANAHARAVASQEAQNARGRAQEEAFRNSVSG